MKTKLLICAALAIMACVSGCNDNIVPEKQYVETSIQCSSVEEQQYAYVELKEATEPILSSATNQDWFRIDDAWMEDLMLAIKVTIDENKTGANRVGQAVLPLKNGTNVRVTINQSPKGEEMSPEDKKKFIANWYNMENFCLANSKIDVYTPWYKDQRNCSAPPKITKQCKPEHGWEVVFIDNRKVDFGVASCYFGLYNRYLGKLRVYTYTSTTEGSSEYMVKYNLGNNKDNIKYAYHSLPVAIPADCSIDTYKKFVSSDGVTFQNLTVPYNEVGKYLGIGWKAFDIDLSAYSPTNKFYTEDVILLGIYFFPTIESVFQLDGIIQGTTTGSFTNPQQPSMSYTGGMQQTIGDFLGTAGETASGFGNLFLSAPYGGVLSNTFLFGGAAASIAGAILQGIPSGGQTYSEGHPGTIELKTQQKITLKGGIISQIASKHPPVTLKKAAFVDKQPYENGNNGKPYIGEGVWSLTTTPTYYIVDDVMLGSTDKVHFEPTGGKDDKYYSTIEKSENVRMVSFFDPTTVQVNINPNVFKDSTEIDKVEVFASPVVELGDKLRYKYTNDYYNLIYGDSIEHNMPICKRHMTYYADSPFKGDEHRVKYYMKLPVEETDIPRTNVESIYEPNKPYGLRGEVSGCDDIKERKFMIDPEILYKPNDNKEGDKTCEGGRIPDILISVIVRVHTKTGKIFVYSHRFLPKIVHITRDKMEGKLSLEDYRNRLYDYAERCRDKNRIVPIDNPASISNMPNYHPTGSENVAHYLKVLDKVINYQYAN